MPSDFTCGIKEQRCKGEKEANQETVQKVKKKKKQILKNKLMVTRGKMVGGGDR